jgi:hypothetical protein
VDRKVRGGSTPLSRTSKPLLHGVSSFLDPAPSQPSGHQTAPISAWRVRRDWPSRPPCGRVLPTALLVPSSRGAARSSLDLALLGRRPRPRPRRSRGRRCRRLRSHFSSGDARKRLSDGSMTKPRSRSIEVTRSRRRAARRTRSRSHPDRGSSRGGRRSSRSRSVRGRCAGQRDARGVRRVRRRRG